MTEDLTDIFRKGILFSERYYCKDIERKIESLPNVWCMLAYDSRRNFYYIGKTDGRSLTEYYGFLSVVFPVALLAENCPDNVRQLLAENGILTGDFNRKCSCDEEILKKYVPRPNVPIIDDRKLLDGRISFDSDDFLTICSGWYLSPYDFDFHDII